MHTHVRLHTVMFMHMNTQNLYPPACIMVWSNPSLYTRSNHPSLAIHHFLSLFPSPCVSGSFSHGIREDHYLSPCVGVCVFVYARKCMYFACVLTGFSLSLLPLFKRPHGNCASICEWVCVDEFRKRCPMFAPSVSQPFCLLLSECSGHQLFFFFLNNIRSSNFTSQ